MRAKPFIIALLLAGPAAAQAVHPAVGLSTSEIIACMGAPDETFEAQNQAFWTYHLGDQIGRDADWCEATVEIAGGAIVDVILRSSNAPGNRGGDLLCRRMFRQCP